MRRTYTIHSVTPSGTLREGSCSERWDAKAYLAAVTRADVIALSGFSTFVRQGERGPVVYRAEALA